MLIPTGLVIKASATGAVVKEVTCANCAGRFYYVLRRTGRGRSSAPLFLGQAEARRKAAAQAQSRLQWLLSQSVDPVPCLHCGHVQPDMIFAAQHQRFNIIWAFVLAGVAFLVPLLYAGVFLDTRAQERAGFVAFAAGGLVFGACLLYRLSYNPNRGRASMDTHRTATKFERFASRVEAEAACAPPPDPSLQRTPPGHPPR